MIGTVPADLSDVQVVKVPFSANLRANIEEHTEGFIKLWIRDNRLIAAQALGFMVSEIGQELANMIALGTEVTEVSKIIHAHPTYAEIIRSAWITVRTRPSISSSKPLKNIKRGSQ